jgi:hypothetical protein
MHARTSLRPSHARALSIGLLVASSIACSKTSSAPEKERTVVPASAVPSTSAAPSASAASAEREPAKNGIPTLVPEPFEALKGMSADLFAIDGALMVAEGLRVGRIVDERVEWIGKIPEENQALSGSRIASVHGYWPDSVDVLYTSNNGRALMPTFFPLTGKGESRNFGPGGLSGWITGIARVGKTTLVAGYTTMTGRHIDTVRGPGLPIKPISAEKGGCKEGEVEKAWGTGEPFAVPFRAIGATGTGTLITFGNLCEREKTPVAEVWDQPGKSRIVDLHELVKDIGYFPEVLTGKGDELWLATDPVLHYRGGTFEALPALEQPFKNVFVSPDGKLHGVSGRTIHRYDDGKWTPVANLTWPMKLNTVAMDDKGTFWVSASGVARLREGRGVEFENGCTTPFVYLYDVDWRNDAKYTFPTTRKALSTFAEISDISLVEYYEGGRRLGITVKSKEQGEAVIAHVKATMKDEHPELLCYAPKSPRGIEMKPAGK